MRLLTFFIIVILIAIATGSYLFTRGRPLVDANDGKNLQLGFAEPSATEVPTVDSRQILAEGQFHNVARTGAGTATIYKDQDGKLILQFTEFETAPADDLQVCLLASEDATVKKTGFLSLAPLKEITGDQSYELPANLDVTKYRAVAILSRRLGVNFATAPLTQQ